MITQGKKNGKYLKDIAEELGVHLRTVRRALDRGWPGTVGRPSGTSKLDPYKRWIDRRLGEGVWNAVVLYREIQEQGYSGEITLVRDYVRPKRVLRSASRRTVRFETLPGQQMQNDWGEIGTRIGGTVTKVYFSVGDILPGFCRPYRPQTKGKVESGVKYVKKNFLVGGRFRELAHLNEELERWNREDADTRLHGTTGCRPIDRFSEERLTLCPLVKPYLQGLPNTRQVTREGFVNWKGNRYSVPWSWGPVAVRVSRDDRNLILLSAKGEEVRHALLTGETGQCRLDLSHHRLEEKNVPTSPCSAGLPPQYDPRWEKEEVERRDLALYDLLEEEVLR
ncbi:transposase [Leptospirillum ferriphilum]|uniref:transposase n=1 Tax=Leptospirillum ferriphilum TaxID=178606 RepID=UPI0015C3C022|nr:transposase [Leptospirillum ferriphilum]